MSNRVFFEGSISRALLLAFLIVSIVPIFITAALFIDQSSKALTERMEDNMQTLVNSKAQEINQHLNEVLHSTMVAAQHSRRALQTPISDAEVAARIGRYQADARNIVGLDAYYNSQGGSDKIGVDLSNVYWNNDVPLTPVAARQIVQTETLDNIYDSIKRVSPDTQWIYVTTPEGMMRLFPWAANDQYPDGWDPRQIVFYTVADRPNNPGLEPRWTAPYVDFAGAGWMVTLSIPMTADNGDLLGIMSHDVTIRELQRLVQDISVLNGVGYGFLIDNNGGVISHPDHLDAEADKGSQESSNLLETGSAEFRAIVRKMIGGQSGISRIQDDGADEFVIYAPVPTIGWSLGIVVPYSAVVAPAVAMRARALTISLILGAWAVGLSLVMRRALHRPLMQLLNGVNQISGDSKADKIKVRSFREFRTLAKAFNEMADRVWERERQLRAKVKELTIEIDAQKRESQLKSVVESDYYQHLEVNAQRLRNQLKGAAGD